MPPTRFIPGILQSIPQPGVESDPKRFTPNSTAAIVIVVGLATIGASAGAFVYDAGKSTPFISALFLFGGGLILHVIGVRRADQVANKVDVAQANISQQVQQVNEGVQAAVESTQKIEKKVNGELDKKIEGTLDKAGEKFAIPKSPEDVNELINRIAECVCEKIEKRAAAAAEKAAAAVAKEKTAERMTGAPGRPWPGTNPGQTQNQT